MAYLDRGLECLHREALTREERLERRVLRLDEAARRAGAGVHNAALARVEERQHGLRDALDAVEVGREDGLWAVGSTRLRESDARIVDESVEGDAFGLEAGRRRSDGGLVGDVDGEQLNLARRRRHLGQDVLEARPSLGRVASAEVDVAAVVTDEELAQGEADAARGAGHKDVPRHDLTLQEFSRLAPSCAVLVQKFRWGC